MNAVRRAWERFGQREAREGKAAATVAIGAKDAATSMDVAQVAAAEDTAAVPETPGRAEEIAATKAVGAAAAATAKRRPGGPVDGEGDVAMETSRRQAYPASEIPGFADYVVVGNSAAGVAAVESIRSLDVRGSICMLSQEPYPAYGKPLISYLIEGKTDQEHLSYRDENFYRRLGIACGFGPACRVVRLDPAAHALDLAGGTRITYGKCLLACGSTAFVPKSIVGWQGRDNIHSFECLDDALAVADDASKATVRAHAAGRRSRAVVVGGGLTGIKAAEALTAIVDEAIVLTHGPRIMSRVLDARASALLIRLLGQRGVRVITNNTVEDFEGEGGRCAQARLTDGTELAFDVAVTAVGVRPATSLAVDAGARAGKGLLVDATMQTTLPGVYAAGDVAQATNALDGSERPLALWTNAVRQGRIAGAQMADPANAPIYGPDYAENVVDFFDIAVMTCGIVNPPAEGGYKEHICDGARDAYAKFVSRDGVLVGYELINLSEACGIYNALIGTRVPLGELDPAVFARAPRNMDFREDARWERLHKGYPRALNRQGFAREPQGEAAGVAAC